MKESVADAHGQLDVNNDLHVQLPSAVVVKTALCMLQHTI